MCDYQIEQAFIKDIRWIKKTKEVVIEREERKEMINAERKERKDYAKRMQDDRKKQQDEIKARNEERKKRDDERKREWELEQLERFDVHPYKRQIEACEQLIYFCAKNRKSETQQADAIEQLKEEASDADRKMTTEKKLDE